MDPALAAFPRSVLKAGTPLFHGTDSLDEFEMPDGPAWFAFDLDAATRWAGWADEPAAGRGKGERRVLSYVLQGDLEIVDVREETRWRSLGEALVGDPETGTGTLAEAVVEAGGAGWLGTAEVMLCAPASALLYRDVLSLYDAPAP